VSQRAQVALDLSARKQREVRDLQLKLQDAIMQVESAQSLFAAEERSFASNRESLRTELARIEHDATAKISQAQVRHASRVQELHRRHDEELRSLSRSLPALPKRRYEPPADVKKKVKTTESPEEEIEDDDDDTTIFAIRVSRLEEQQRELVQIIRQEQRAADSRLAQLANVRDEEEAEFAAEVEQIQAKMERQEELYRQQAERLSNELEGVRDVRRKAAAVNDRQIEEWQSKIERIDEEFRLQLRETTVTAETLKAALSSINLRKSERLEAERKGAQDRQNLRKETLHLQFEVFNKERQVQIARNESEALRRELSARIGTRRTASLFM
jgi:hypothetical protein